VLFRSLVAVILYGRHSLAEAGQRWIFFRLVAVSPLIHVLVFWLGKSDPFLVIAYMLLLVARQPVVVCGLSLVLTLAHPEQATVVLFVHLVLERPGRSLVLVHVLGWAMGLAVGQAYLAQLGLVGSPRVVWLANRLDLLVRANLLRRPCWGCRFPGSGSLSWSMRGAARAGGSPFSWPAAWS